MQLSECLKSNRVYINNLYFERTEQEESLLATQKLISALPHNVTLLI